MEELALHHVGHRGTRVSETSLEHLLHWHSHLVAGGGLHGQGKTDRGQRRAVQDAGPRGVW